MLRPFGHMFEPLKFIMREMIFLFEIDIFFVYFRWRNGMMIKTANCFPSNKREFNARSDANFVIGKFTVLIDESQLAVI